MKRITLNILAMVDIISGSTRSYGFGGSDIWLIKSGSNGLIEWNTYIGTEHDEQGGQIIQTEDSGYLVVGNRTNEQEKILMSG